MEAPRLLLHLLLLLLVELWGHSGTLAAPGGTREGLLYPFGPGEGDEATAHEDDGTSPEIRLEEPFAFYGRAQNTLYVSTNGLLSFGVPVAAFTPEPFPLPGGRPLVAPFWADVDLRLGGDVFFRQSRDPKLLRRLSRDLRDLPEASETPPEPTWAFVATWDRVSFFGAASDKTNTFQAVLASDGEGSGAFVVLNYRDLEWSSGIANGGDPHTGQGGSPAQAGFDSGDSAHFFSLPGSRTPRVLSVAGGSNVGVPGRWIFRVDPPQGPLGATGFPTAAAEASTVATGATAEEKIYVCEW